MNVYLDKQTFGLKSDVHIAKWFQEELNIKLGKEADARPFKVERKEAYFRVDIEVDSKGQRKDLKKTVK